MGAIVKQYSCDFETTVFKGQTETEVWAAAMVDLEAPDEESSVDVYNSIDVFMSKLFFLSKKYNLICFFHNLKFDGTFILNYLKNNPDWTEDSEPVYDEDGEYKCDEFLKKSPFKMQNRTYRYAISDKGMWYTITLKSHYHTIEFRDSLKLLPFSVKQLGKGFDLKHRKLEMEYEGVRYAGCPISVEERHYIANDVLVVKEALNFMHSQGHEGLTIGSCCLEEYKKQYTKTDWNKKFPDLYAEPLTNDMTMGDFVRLSYKGGWCYVVPEKSNKEYHKKGITCDVNSLYPSMMHSESGNRYPIGSPTYWKGDIPEEAKAPDKYYFIHIKTRFYIKENMLPTIMIKGNALYPNREWLTSSDVVDFRIKGDAKYLRVNRKRYYIDEEGQVKAARPDLYLTMTDWELMQKHYNLEDTEIIEGMYFDTEIGLFDDYINKYAEIKQKSKGPLRQLAKLFLNNLYGKFATSTDSSYKIMYLNEDDCLRSYSVSRYDKTPGYIPIGSAITSYARAFTITAAQANYYGPDKPGFIYADTDSIHCDLLSEEIKGAPKHPTKFNHWKYEATWDFAKFVRAKTYVEHVIEEDEVPLEEIWDKEKEEYKKPYYNMKCAGMSDHVKELFLYSVEQNVSRETYEKLDKDEQEFVDEKRTFADFAVGLEIPGMLKAKNIKGGTLLVKNWYKMRKNIEV